MFQLKARPGHPCFLCSEHRRGAKSSVRAAMDKKGAISEDGRVDMPTLFVALSFSLKVAAILCYTTPL